MRIITFLIAMLMAVPAFAVEMGDDGLHKPTWLRTTFKDLQEDLASANEEGKRLVVIVEQRGMYLLQQDARGNFSGSQN